jgi:hypothetical protein
MRRREMLFAQFEWSGSEDNRRRCNGPTAEEPVMARGIAGHQAVCAAVAMITVVRRDLTQPFGGC